MPATGQRVSEYVLEDRLGQGAFGEVWRARHHAWHDQVVAVKLPHDGGLIRQLQREGGLVQGLDHSNVVKPLGFDAFADPPYLVSEYVAGGNLRGPIERREFTPARAVSVLRDILSGLAYAHGKGIVHRDLKPENVMLTADGRAKIADFGLGQTSAATAASAVYSLSLDDAAAKSVVGTLDYMSPEQRAGGAVDARADLYAVSVVLFEMLTGQKPAGHDVPGDLNPTVPAYLNDVFRRGYARADKRFASAREFAAALDAAVPPAMPIRPAGGTVSATAPATPGGLTGIPPLPTGVSSKEGKSAGASKPSKSKSKPCVRCRRDVDANDQFCMHCGVQLTAHVRRCGRCGAYPDAGDDFCLRCGDAVAPKPPTLHRIG